MNGARPTLVIVSGLSGSGKSVALKTFEDLDYYCADNLPVGLLVAVVMLVCMVWNKLPSLVASVVDTAWPASVATAAITPPPAPAPVCCATIPTNSVWQPCLILWSRS